jgi:hypothetical protein
MHIVWIRDNHYAEVLSPCELANFFTMNIHFFAKIFLENSGDSIKKIFYLCFCFENQIRQGFLRKLALNALILQHFRDTILLKALPAP